MIYSELKTAVEDTVENTFSATDFANMTALAEQKIYQTVQLPILRKTTSYPLTQGDSSLDLPSDFLAMYSIALVVSATGQYEFLLNKDVNFIRESYPVPAQGQPKYYALNGTSNLSPLLQKILLAPAPTFGLNVELNYFYQPVGIAVATNTWLSENFPSVLINAVLVEAARFMKAEQDIVQLYMAQFNESLLLLKNLGDGKNRMDAYRSGQVRNPVK